jgi:hypothetical protein
MMGLILNQQESSFFGRCNFMGVPLSNFTILKFLADGNEREKAGLRSFEMEYALDAMENYSVFAFVLHDPTVHKDFHEFLGKQFGSLHYSSGQHLVFFGLVDSPKKYCLTGNQPFYTDIRDAVELIESEHGNEKNYSYSAFSLANSLKIETDQLPVIVVTHDPRCSSYKWYKTCLDKLETQMSRLTGIANQMFYFKNHEHLTLNQNQDVLFKFLEDQELNLCKGMGSKILDESMAQILSDLLSFLIQNENETNEYNNRHREVVRISNKHSKTALQRTILNLKNFKNRIKELDVKDIEDHELFPKMVDINIKIGIYLTILQKSTNSTSDMLPIKDSLLENHSLHLLQTGLDVEAILRNKKIPLDYSPSAICLAKMFENEINLSIVHWIRKQYSIELPRYFNKVQPEKLAYVSPNFPSGPGTQVNFNLEKNGTWQPPELGKSKTIAQYNLSKKDWQSIGITHSFEFLSDWNTIHQVRNKAAHTTIVSLSDLEKLKNALSNMAKNNSFDKLADLKNSFRSSLA